MKSKLYLFFVFLGISYFANSQEIYQWRGKARDGIYVEKNLLKSWSASGLQQIWSVENIGKGYGSPVVTPDKLFINGEIDSVSYLFAFDLSGKLIWKTPNGKEFYGNGQMRKFEGSRSTPTVYNDLIFISSGLGRIACVERKTGKELWAKDMIEDFKGVMPFFGYSESLLADEKNVYCFPGGTVNNIMALDKLTGKTIWTTKGLGDSATYNSPMFINLPSRKLIVIFSNFYLLGFDAANGELLWQHKQDKVQRKQQCNTAIYENGFIYYVAGDGNGVVKLELSQDGKSIKEIWRLPKVENNFSGFVKVGDYLYSGDRNKLKCIDAKTGQLADTLKLTRGAIIAAENMLYCYDEKGMMNLIKLNGAKIELISSFKVEKGSQEHFAHPVIDKGILYLRHGNALMAYKISEN